MLRRVAWFTAVIGYVIQTKGFSIIQSKKFMDVDPAKESSAKLNGFSNEEMKRCMTIYLAFIYFVSLLLLLPITSFFTDKIGSMGSGYSRVPDGTDERENMVSNSSEEEYELQNIVSPRPSALSLDLTLQLDTSAAHSQDTAISTKSTVQYIGKLLFLTIFTMIPVFTYMLALSLSPAFDVALIQNTAVFEIVTLLYGVCGIARKNHVFRNFLVMMAALASIQVISYTKATCDMLAGKLSINPSTGEVTDLFLFDRLKASLICGLGSLSVGVFAVMWHRWFGKPSASLIQQSSHLSLIGIMSIILLLPFVPDLKLSYQVISFYYADKTFWLTLMGSLFFGTVPCLFSLLHLNKKNPPEFVTTVNLGSIIFMGLAEWLTEPIQTTIVRWEVIGYIVLVLSCIFLSMTLR
ncbi:mannosylinositol phosphorylceramide synthase regulatory subunit KNAG_0K01620 [Huiozyma naganishii CBS 8797]|uniref:EamA domain-containing protein n=1 Tax=Huiozyma naganishii (strain ATCC MYA-139 / BCRC 22969 / CBS 8797 / KCTC 17520 / NBRC 10181 / NCYC 3082 / Yp74L-3) TaxID=1071383 RepID=J7RRP8_HUIN7|nr:hypothetical protein KNAG_0K01620 [Kazachstania naganishii CBS 8797]CCK72523.1 hypothetical protein KNAG_0K01620 [Kazachstania naganishii CBS 8797]